ncbi:MAG: LCP family protein [Solirubrobacterales bacterium]
MVLLAVVVVLVVYFNSQLNKVKKVQLPKVDSELNISDNAAKEDNDIINIALFGLDRRAKDETSRSDALLVLTLDKLHKEVKVSSIMRDSYVDVSGYGNTKITHAYAYGGPTLAIKTLNENFDLNIRDYASVDFFGLEKIIDSVGGIEINITSEELKYINFYIDETSTLENEKAPLITSTGVQNLNGRQAVAYSRIRYTAGGDYERTERQRTVLAELFKKIKAAGAANVPKEVLELLPYTETSLSNADIVKYGTSIFSMGINNIEQQRFPEDGFCEGKTINGVWYLVFDLEATKKQMHNFIFDK